MEARKGNIYELLDEDVSESEVRQAVEERREARKPLALQSKGITRESDARPEVLDRLDAKRAKKQRRQRNKSRLKHLY